MSSLAIKGLSLLQKLEIIIGEVRKQESLKLQHEKQKDIIAKTALDISPIQVEEISEDVGLWNSKIDILTNDNKDLKSKCEKLMLQLRSKDSSIQNLNEKIRLLNSSCETLQKEKDSKYSECLGKWNDILKIDSLLKAIASERDTQRNLVNRCQEQFNEQLLQTNKLKEDLDASNRANINLNTKTSAVLVCNTELLLKLEEVSKLNASMKIDSIYLKSEGSRMQSLLDSKDISVAASNKKIETLIKEIELERKCRETTENTLSKYEADFQQHSEQLSKACHEITELGNKNEELRNKLREAEAKLSNPPPVTSITMTTTTTTTNMTMSSDMNFNAPQAHPSSVIATVPPKPSVSKGPIVEFLDEEDPLWPASLAASRNTDVATGDKIPVVMNQVSLKRHTDDSDSSPTPKLFKRKKANGKVQEDSIVNSVTPAVIPLTLHKKTSAPLSALSSSNSDSVSALSTLENCTHCNQLLYGMTTKCCKCNGMFHVLCKRKMLQQRAKASEDIDVDVIPTAASVFLCDNCFES